MEFRTAKFGEAQGNNPVFREIVLHEREVRRKNFMLNQDLVNLSN